MTEWGVIGVLVVIAGLFGTVGGPVLKLNATITRLQTVLDALKDDLAAQKSKSTEAHRRLWAHNEEQDARLDEHDMRIAALEQRQNGGETI